MDENQIPQKRPNAREIARAIESRDWDTLDRLTGMSPEEAERILREEPMIDAAEVNKLLCISDDEIDTVMKLPPPEFRPE